MVDFGSHTANVAEKRRLPGSSIKDPVRSSSQVSVRSGLELIIEGSPLLRKLRIQVEFRDDTLSYQPTG